MKTGRFLLVGCVLLGAATAYGGDNWVDPSRVLVVYDSAFSDYDFDGIPDSEAVAWYYVVRRGIDPATNLLAVDCSSVVDYDNRYFYNPAEWGNFHAEVAVPIQNKLTALGSTNIDYIVLCYGVPYRLGINLTGDPADDFGVSVAATVADVFNVGDATTPASDFDPGLANPTS